MIELTTKEANILLHGLNLVIEEEQDSICHTDIYYKLKGEIEHNEVL